jgi:hypothetical protein
MRSTLLILIGLITGTAAMSQTPADSISVTFPKIVVVNGDNRVLLTFDKNRQAYELPSIGFLNGPISWKQYVDSAATEIGVEYSSFRLGGIFTYIFPDKFRTFIRPYFVLKFRSYLNGTSVKGSAYQWFSFSNAIKKIPYPASARILERILSKPSTVWAATFEEYNYTNPIDKSKMQFRVLEGFYKLKKNAAHYL